MVSPWHFFAFVFGLCCFSNRARQTWSPWWHGIAFTGEEASGLCSHIFEGHYAEEAACLWLIWQIYGKKWNVWDFPREVIVQSKPRCGLFPLQHNAIPHNYSSLLFVPIYSLSLRPSRHSRRSLGWQCRLGTAAAKFARIRWCLANLA